MRSVTPAWPPSHARVEHQWFDALARRVHRGGEPGRATADHEQAEERSVGPELQAQLHRELGVRGSASLDPSGTIVGMIRLPSFSGMTRCSASASWSMSTQS